MNRFKTLEGRVSFLEKLVVTLAKLANLNEDLIRPLVEKNAVEDNMGGGTVDVDNDIDISPICVKIEYNDREALAPYNKANYYEGHFSCEEHFQVGDEEEEIIYQPDNEDGTYQNQVQIVQVLPTIPIENPHPSIEPHLLNHKKKKIKTRLGHTKTKLSHNIGNISGSNYTYLSDSHPHPDHPFQEDAEVYDNETMVYNNSNPHHLSFDETITEDFSIEPHISISASEDDNHPHPWKMEYNANDSDVSDDDNKDPTWGKSKRRRRKFNIPRFSSESTVTVGDRRSYMLHPDGNVEDLEIHKSFKNRPVIIYREYIYRIDKKSGDTDYYVCTNKKKGCKARMTVYKREGKYRTNKDHSNHSPHSDIHRLKEILQIRASSTRSTTVNDLNSSETPNDDDCILLN